LNQFLFLIFYFLKYLILSFLLEKTQQVPPI
jgi:hypothetical protein